MVNTHDELSRRMDAAAMVAMLCAENF